jgi:hypothetical protein
MSSKVGHAMRGTDPSKMLGAVVGKALDHCRAATEIEVPVKMQ